MSMDTKNDQTFTQKAQAGPSTPNSMVEEISIHTIAIFFRKNLLLLMASVLLFAAIGYGISRQMPVEYRASAKILPEASGMNMGGLGGLANMAGISLSQSPDAINPDIFPDIIQSKSFLIKLLTTPMPTSDKKMVVLMEYLGKGTKPLSPPEIAQADSLIVLTMEQEGVVGNVANRMKVSIDRMTGILTLEVEMPDPVLAAYSTKFIINYLTKFVSEYRSGRENQKVVFLTSQVGLAKQKYQRAEYALNAYRDRHRNPFTNVSQIEEQRLQNEFTQYQNLYADLNRQLETARLESLQESPVLKIIEPPMVPNGKSSPRTVLIMLLAGFIGGSLSMACLLFIRKK
jgi:uncharacterized protein involved in exopolysaccharide biosynthesis